MRALEACGQEQSAPQLPEKVMMALVSTPAVFAVPSSINKGFNPPFVLRVGVVSAAPTQIKATVAAYVLQKDQASFCCPLLCLQLSQHPEVVPYLPAALTITEGQVLPLRACRMLCLTWCYLCLGALNKSLACVALWAGDEGGRLCAGGEPGEVAPSTARGDREPERCHCDPEDCVPWAQPPQAATALPGQAHRRRRVCLQR